MTISGLVPPAVPLDASDELISAAVEQATLGALLPALAHVTGDLDLVPVHLRPNPDDFMDPQGGMTADQLDEAKALAVDTLIGLRDGVVTRSAPPTDDTLRRLVAHIVGDANVDAYLDLLLEELSPEGVDRRAPGWRKDEVAPDTAFHVAIVGAGMSGLLAAHRLAQAGVAFTIFEKNDEVGGTWFDNTYPGCRVDVPNHLYSYSFAHTVWPQHFSDQATLLDYFCRCADDFDVRDHIRFGAEVLGAEWSDEPNTWCLRVRGDGQDAAEETFEANALISAVGQLNRPNMPAISGIDKFEGPSFHSARWRHDVDLRAKRVAVIGTGASAAQFIPEVAAQAAELVVFQRTPNWLAPTPDYHEDVADETRWMLGALPEYGDWHRLWLFWRMHEGLTAAAKVDPDWQSDTGSVSALNEMVRIGLVEYLHEQFADRPDLLPHVVPTYPPIAKRIVRDNGIWARTLSSDHVRLVTDPIERVTPTGVEAGGTSYEADVIIYGTGFTASQFLMPMKVTGRPGPERPLRAGNRGLDLHEHWSGDARAYLGITVPHFPNLFCLYGPNTNIVINGSIIFFSECEVRYVTDSLRMLLESGHRAMDCRTDVHDAFNRRVDDANRQMAWGASSVNSWYKNATGRVAQNWPFSLLEYWQATRTPDPADYELT